MDRIRQSKRRKLLFLLMILAILWTVWSLTTSLSFLDDAQRGRLEKEGGGDDNDIQGRLTTTLSKQSFVLPMKEYSSINDVEKSEEEEEKAFFETTKKEEPVVVKAPKNNAGAYSSNNNNITAGFIHLGKTGGSSIARVLQNGCSSNRPKPCKPPVANETMASKLVQDYFHIVMDTARIASSDHDIYILSTRDVYDRFVSAFVYLHPRNQKTFQRNSLQSITREDMVDQHKAYRCFRNGLESFAQYLGDEPLSFQYNNPDVIQKGNCTNLSRAIVAGRVKALGHMYNNYQNMLHWIPSSSSERRRHRDIYLVRQEHLWDDWIRINQMLGQTEDVVLPDIQVRRNVTEIMTQGQAPPVTKDVSNDGRDRLCQALAPEYQAYFELLRQARNIEENDIQEAVNSGKERCPNLDFEEIRKSSSV
jgi:hypothetical protein